MTSLCYNLNGHYIKGRIAWRFTVNRSMIYMWAIL